MITKPRLREAQQAIRQPRPGLHRAVKDGFVGSIVRAAVPNLALGDELGGTNETPGIS